MTELPSRGGPAVGMAYEVAGADPIRAAAPGPGGSAPGALGRVGERLAAEHLSRRGLVLVARNVRTARGEIDIVARDGTTLVFVEVKTRRRARPGRPASPAGPLERLGRRQQARLRRLAAAYLREHARGRPYAAIRLDAIGVTVDFRGRLVTLEHLEGAW